MASALNGMPRGKPAGAFICARLCSCHRAKQAHGQPSDRRQHPSVGPTRPGGVGDTTGSSSGITTPRVPPTGDWSANIPN
jgi:hypothetical protein